MGAIRPGSGGGGGGAASLGDLSDIGVMGEPVAQSDNLTEVVTALGGAAAVRTALDVAQDGATITYTLGGSPVDYTGLSAYAPSGLTTTGGSPSTAVSGRLGDGVSVPYFTAFRKSEIAALARTSTGLRLTRVGTNSGVLTTWPYSDAGAVIRIPLPRTLRDVQVDITLAVAMPVLAAGGSDIMEALVALVRHKDGARAYTFGGAWIYTFASDFAGAPAEYAWGPEFVTTDTQRDVSSAGEGTTGAVTVRDVRIVLAGDTVEVLTGPAGGALARRAYFESVAELDAREGLAVVVSLTQLQATPATGYYAELRSLTLTPL